jgi:hypothetical protein
MKRTNSLTPEISQEDDRTIVKIISHYQIAKIKPSNMSLIDLIEK